MEKLIDLKSYPVNVVLNKLLQDKSTKKNIIFATDAYSEDNPVITATTPITKNLLLKMGLDIQPRVLKSQEQQAMRTRKKAEVFTPSWICNKMNNHCDEEWFGCKGIFNTETEQDWIVNTKPIPFRKHSTWKQYVYSTRLEITCGEAPYLVSRYDTVTGELIPIERRIGILDRKLRVVNENTQSEQEWLKWVKHAYQSVYGYEFQGDNLLIARINLLVTFVDYMQDKWNRVPSEGELKIIANIIAWNIWQMDGIKGVVPFGMEEKVIKEYQQMSLFDITEENEKKKGNEHIECIIYDWRKRKSFIYNSMRKG